MLLMRQVRALDEEAVTTVLSPERSSPPSGSSSGPRGQLPLPLQLALEVLRVWLGGARPARRHHRRVGRRRVRTAPPVLTGARSTRPGCPCSLSASPSAVSATCSSPTSWATRRVPLRLPLPDVVDVGGSVGSSCPPGGGAPDRRLRPTRSRSRSHHPRRAGYPPPLRPSTQRDRQPDHPLRPRPGRASTRCGPTPHVGD